MVSACLVIGAGWYGCHLASVLVQKGHRVCLVDKANALFQGASSKNQNRLHQGLHYPRSLDTIRECQEGFQSFVKKYPSLSMPIRGNYYFIADTGSKVSMDEYKRRLVEYAIPHTIESVNELPLAIRGVGDDCIITDERYIDPKKAAAYFQSTVGSLLVPLEPEAFDSIASIRSCFPKPFDCILNCTYNQLEPIPFGNYELYLTLLYRIEGPETFAYTLMDGDFFSIYPYRIEEQIYTVTSVRHGVVDTPVRYDASISVSDAVVAERRALVEADLHAHLPDWTKRATYVGHHTSWKTKPVSDTCDRSLRWKQDGPLLSLYGGKLTGIFQAERLLETHLADLGLN
jgi:hypothetical protein